MEFSLTTELCEQSNGQQAAVIFFNGPIDRSGLLMLDNTVQDLYRQDIYFLIFDLANTTSINSSAIGLLINITQQVAMGNGAVRIIRVAEKFKILFELLGLESRLPIAENKEQALASFIAK